MTVEKVKFSLKDVGSEIVDQLSKDIYSDRGSIFRELTKNAYDAYLDLPDGLLEEEEKPRVIVIQRAEIEDEGRKITITDHGMGQDLSDIKGFVQIGIARKKDVLDGATGFRGLGSWSIMGAGSRIKVISSKLGVPSRYILTLDVRKIYAKLGPKVTLDDILNDPDLLHFEREAWSKEEHFTTVEILCDGKPERINGYEINRLWEFADPNDKELEGVLTRYCALPFTSQGGAHSDIYKIYKKVGYEPTPIVLDGVRLERSLPASLTDVQSKTLEISGKTVAHVWYASNPKRSRILDEQELETSKLGDPSLQLVRLNVPIGKKGAYKDGTRSTDQWYVGEIHIVAEDILPNAGGDDLREGTAREAFVERVRKLYEELDDEASAKSVRLSLVKKVEKGRKAKKEIDDNPGMSKADKVELENQIREAVQQLEKATARTKATSEADKILRKAASADDVKAVLRAARQEFSADDTLSQFSSQKTQKGRQRKQAKPAPTPDTGTAAKGALLPSDIQARLGRAVPLLEQAGLAKAQIEAVLKIVRQVLS
jgi:hypothetical protein